MLRILCVFLLLTGKSLAQSPLFKAEVIDPKISIGYGLAIGDVDGDGREDILMADQKEIVWYRNPGQKQTAWTRYVMARNLTPRDNVCIAARDLDGDGKVEVAVGAQWNPAETKNLAESGAVFYLYPSSSDRTQPWQSIKLPHEVTIHRMQWVKDIDGGAQLIVLPLHGLGNVNQEGVGVNLMAFRFPKNIHEPWPLQLLNTQMHVTHNFDPIEVPGRMLGLAVAGKQGVQVFLYGAEGWSASGNWLVTDYAVSEVRRGKRNATEFFTATIEPFHGNQLVVYTKDGRTLLSDRIRQGHGLVSGDFLGLGHDQIAMGWREPNANLQVGLRLYVPSQNQWSEYALDESVTMACEDLKAADLDGDGDLDLIAAGRSSKNVVIYWNQRIP
jgi:hypothetical protein